MRIVKQIEVVDAKGGQDFNQTMVRLDAVGYWPKTAITPQAKITLFADTPNGPREKQIKVKHGADLARLTNRSDYVRVSDNQYQCGTGKRISRISKWHRGCVKPGNGRDE
jgi:hypothetical protein